MVLKNFIMIAISCAILFFLFLYPILYPLIFHLPEKELVVLGLDGGDYETVQSLLQGGKLPNLEKIVSEGTFSTFQTASKLDSYSAWNSLAICNETSLWDELNMRNVTYGTLYWPNAPKTGLFRVPDEFEGGNEWPEDIYDSKALLIFKNPVTEFFRKIFWLKIMLPQNKIEKDLVYEFYLLDIKARELFYMREKFAPKLSFLVLSSPLRIEQYFWMHAHPEKFGNYLSESEREKYGSAIERYYIELDDFIGKINKQGKTMVIVSNRGVREKYPPNVVDKIDVNKILKELGMLEFDYRGEIDFSRTKAYTYEEGLDQELKIFIDGENIAGTRDELKEAFDSARSLPSGQKIFTIENFESGIVLKRNIPFLIEDDRFSISNKTFAFSNFVLRRTISAVPEERGFLMINRKVELPEKMTSEDFCCVVLKLIS